MLQAEAVGASDVLGADVDMSYIPRTRDTRIAYESLLSFIQQELGAQEHDVLRSAADEILAILKDDNLKVSARSLHSVVCSRLVCVTRSGTRGRVTGRLREGVYCLGSERSGGQMRREERAWDRERKQERGGESDTKETEKRGRAGGKQAR